MRISREIREKSERNSKEIRETKYSFRQNIRSEYSFRPKIFVQTNIFVKIFVQVLQRSTPLGPPPPLLEAPGPSFQTPPPHLPWTPLPPPRTSPQPIPTTLQLMLPCSCQVALVFVFSGASYEGTSLHGQARDFLRRLAESICRLFLGSPEQESRGSLPNRSRGSSYMLLDQLRCMCKAGASADT